MVKTIIVMAAVAAVSVLGRVQLLVSGGRQLR